MLALRPEICTLDFNTMWFGTAAVINTPRNLRIMAEKVQDAGGKPELEVFDTGDVQLANAFLEDGLIAKRAMFQIVLGVKYGAVAAPASMQHLQSLLPRDADWAAFGIGRQAFPMVAQSWLLGGHCRVGLEDTLRLSKQKLATSNAVLVERAVRIIRELGGLVATPGEAREILKLKKLVAK